MDFNSGGLLFAISEKYLQLLQMHVMKTLLNIKKRFVHLVKEPDLHTPNLFFRIMYITKRHKALENVVCIRVDNFAKPKLPNLSKLHWSLH